MWKETWNIYRGIRNKLWNEIPTYLSHRIFRVALSWLISFWITPGIWLSFFPFSQKEIFNTWKLYINLFTGESHCIAPFYHCDVAYNKQSSVLEFLILPLQRNTVIISLSLSQKKERWIWHNMLNWNERNAWFLMIYTPLNLEVKRLHTWKQQKLKQYTRERKILNFKII